MTPEQLSALRDKLGAVLVEEIRRIHPDMDWIPGYYILVTDGEAYRTLSNLDERTTVEFVLASFNPSDTAVERVLIMKDVADEIDRSKNN